MKQKSLTTLKQLRAELPAIIKEYGTNSIIARAATVNPIFALEEIGYKLSDALKKEVDYQIRFGESGKRKLLRLEKQIFKVLGREFQLTDEEAIRKNIKPLLKGKRLRSKKTTQQMRYSFKLDPKARIQKFVQEKADPLEAFREDHEVIPMLLKFREVQSSMPRLGDRKTFNSLLKSDTVKGFRLTSVTFRMQAKDN